MRRVVAPPVTRCKRPVAGLVAPVEFVARYQAGGASAARLHEVSRFVREHGRWYYLDGEFPGR